MSSFGTVSNFQGAVPTNGTFAAVILTYADLSSNNHFLVSRFSGSTWTTQHTEQFTTQVVTPDTPYIAIDNSGNIATITSFDDSMPNTLLYGWGTGETTGQVLSGAIFEGKGFAPVTVDNNGRAYVVWYDTSYVVHGKNFLFSQPSSWSLDATATPSLISPVISRSSPDANGHLSVVLSDFGSFSFIDEATFTASTSPSSAGSWSAIVQVSDNTENNTLSGDQPIASNPSGAVIVGWVNDDGMGDRVIQEVHKASIGSSFTSILEVTPGNNIQFYISNNGNKALIARSTNFIPASILLSVYVDDVVVGPNPPTNFIGVGGKNKFLTQTERFNTLTWTASTTPTVVNYLLFRNGDLIGVIPATGPLLFVDHNRNKYVTDMYTLYAVDTSGAQSTAATVVVR